MKKLKSKKEVCYIDEFNLLYNDVYGALIPYTPKEEKGDLEVVYKTPNLFDFDDDTIEAFEIEREEEDRIKDWIGNNGQLKFELLFRGSRDGYSMSEMHGKCDGKGPVVFLVKANSRVFGGYISIPIQSKGGDQADDKAFIFSLYHKKKLEQFQNQ